MGRSGYSVCPGEFGSPLFATLENVRLDNNTSNQDDENYENYENSSTALENDSFGDMASLQYMWSITRAIQCLNLLLQIEKESREEINIVTANMEELVQNAPALANEKEALVNTCSCQ